MKKKSYPTKKSGHSAGREPSPSRRSVLQADDPAAEQKGPDLDIPDIVSAGRGRTSGPSGADDDGGIEISSIEIDGVEISSMQFDSLQTGHPSTLIRIEDRMPPSRPSDRSEQTASKKKKKKNRRQASTDGSSGSHPARNAQAQADASPENKSAPAQHPEPEAPSASKKQTAQEEHPASDRREDATVKLDPAETFASESRVARARSARHQQELARRSHTPAAKAAGEAPQADSADSKQNAVENQPQASSKPQSRQEEAGRSLPRARTASAGRTKAGTEAADPTASAKPDVGSDPQENTESACLPATIEPANASLLALDRAANDPALHPGQSDSKSSPEKDPQTEGNASGDAAAGALESADSRLHDPDLFPEDGLKGPGADKERRIWSSDGFARFLRPGWICLLIVLIALGLLVWRMLELSLFKLSLAGLVLGLGLAGMALAGYWFFFTRSRWWQLPAVLLCVGLTLLSILGQGQLSTISRTLETISDPADAYVETVGLYAPSLIPISDLKTLSNETIGVIPDRQSAGTQALLDDLQKQGITLRLKQFTSLQQMYKAVRGQAVRAVILTPSDVKLIQEMNGVGQSGSQLSMVYSLPIQTNIAVPISEKNLETDPYTVLVSVSNDPLSEASYRSTLNLLVTVNPTTRQILTTVIPKSLYVSSSCSPELACPPESIPDRVSFTSYHSIEALRQTLEHLMGSPIDFAVRIDMDHLLQLFDVQTGIRFSTDSGYADVTGGTQTRMTGPQIKRYLGNTDDLSADDLDQELSQLRVLLTLSNAYRQANLLSLRPALGVLEESIWTSFSYHQLAELLRQFYLFPEPFTAEYELITGDQATPYSPTLTENTYVSVARQQTLDHAKAAIQAVLAGQTPQTTGLPDPAGLQTLQPAQPAPAPESQAASSEAAQPVQQDNSEQAAATTDQTGAEPTLPAAPAEDSPEQTPLVQPVETPADPDDAGDLYSPDTEPAEDAGQTDAGDLQEGQE